MREPQAFPGQFYRFQNYEARAKLVQGTRLTMEGIALTGAWVAREQGLLSFILLEMGGSTRLCAGLEPGEPVVVANAFVLKSQLLISRLGAGCVD